MASRQARPFAPDERAQRKADPNKRWRWLIPFVIAAQVALKVSMRPGPVPALSRKALLHGIAGEAGACRLTASEAFL